MSVSSGRPFHGLRMLAVHAHPDDESSKGAATTALYTSLGARVMIATMTGGEAGDILNPALLNSPAARRDIAGLRRDEMAAAAEELGAEHRWIGFVDSGLPEGDPATETPHGSFYQVPTDVAARPLVHLIRSFRPHVLTTYDERGGYPHPDHIKNHIVSMTAVEQAADAAVNPELGEPWQVQKVYYNMDLSPRKWLAIHEKMTAEGHDSPFADMLEKYRSRDGERNSWLTARIACGQMLERSDRALLSHATQIDPKGGFFSEARKIAKTFWPTEEFELAIDNTGREALDRGSDFLESDLFAGVTRDDGRRIPDAGLLEPYVETRAAVPSAGQTPAEKENV
ncbi:mycothiol conjugate amidase Mca [Brevibacterium luteolum]|uniref:mycothiol conjugate amidase Mca n=1 Tax=Brevibacterium luteolum TaxID=199591 RepID=UPI0021AEB6FA|nr:mycothiol conjugate amidase Mca [Brevibacterium luteolum]MCT1873945.1 mycothiol conjugate amidase Mca [Brevibacterium luteolum]MCT1891273.1 mycothiol conjugate amidase Mca [Brevibacterium luteolum]MCT1893866.1 mycothiol conjugate amidase Mca [Brevibacterium luteolum]MCT1924667.1 mycothiol conjugate amidase Mca [Brevibacterium luteolum]